MIIRGVLVFTLPFLLAGMIKSIIELKEEKGAGPIPYCLVMGVLLVIIVNIR